MTQQATLTAPSAVSRQEALPLNEAGEPLFHGLTAAAWLKVAIVSVLMIATFRFNLYRLWLKTNPFSGELNWRHSIVVPIVGLYYLYVNRDDLLKARAYVAWSGLPILVLGILLFGYGIWPGQNDFIKDFGMVVALFGVVAFLCGWQVMKIAWFPIVFLVCAIPWPELVYSYIASPLQHLAASVAVGTLRLTGVEAMNQGTKILMEGPKGYRALNVAEACAGLRSLMTFISVGAAVAFLSERPLWQKILITFSAIPIAIFCNVMRVSGQGLLHHYWSEAWSEGFAHQFAGTVMLVPGFLFIVLVCWILDRMFIEVADVTPSQKRSSLVRAAAGAADWSMSKPVAPVAARALPAVSKPQVITKAQAAPTAVPTPAVKKVQAPVSGAKPGVAGPAKPQATGKPPIAGSAQPQAAPATPPRPGIVKPPAVKKIAPKPPAPEEGK